MVVAATLVIVIATMAVVLWPLLAPAVATARRRGQAQDLLEALLAERDSAYDAIRDLDFEHHVGNLSEEDYLELRGRYRDQAAEVLRRLEGAEAARPPAPAVVDARAAAEPAPPVADGARQPSAPRVRPRRAPAQGPGTKSCPVCGRVAERAARYCSRCGESLEASHDR